MVEDIASGPYSASDWNEHDVPPLTLPTREGFGTRLLNRFQVIETAADVDVACDAEGLRVHVRMPLGRLIQLPA